MPVNKETRLAILLDAAKAWGPAARARIGEWYEACREEPSLIWQTSAVRYAVYVAGGVLLAMTLSFVVSLLTPPAPEGARPRARSADFHVLCDDPACGVHFVITRRFGFDDFPVNCPKCNALTGEPAVRCLSAQCGGAWVIAVQEDGTWRCRACGAPVHGIE